MRIRLDIPLALSEIESAVGGEKRLPLDERLITHISTDSRTVMQGDLFIALTGGRYRGADFLGEASQRGAVTLSVGSTPCDIAVNDSSRALLLLAEYYKTKLPKLKYTVMITGSVGKSTAKEFLKAIVSEALSVHATAGNLNNLIGAPLTVLSAKRSTEALIVEAGMNAIGEISKISSAVKPDIGIITNIGTAHIGMLGCREGIARAKSEITDGMTDGCVLVPYGEPLLEKIAGRRTLSLGYNEGADYSFEPLLTDTHGSRAVIYKGASELMHFCLNIPGEHLLTSLCMAIAASDIMGIGLESVKRGIDSIGMDMLRSRFVELSDFTVLDDSYNASAESVIADLKLLSLFKDRPKAALLGDMLELGEDSERLHREIGLFAAKSGIERLYLYGEYARFIMEGALLGKMAKESIFINENVSDPMTSAEQILNHRQKGELILFKASHALSLSRIIDYIKLRQE